VALRLIHSASIERKVTWLELFFDLVFVAAVAQVAEPLREHYTVAELTRFTPLFLLVWWAWTGRALFSTRFGTEDHQQRALTLLEMFAVAVMAANARDSLASRSSAGFAAAYAGVRLILLAHYLRAMHVREARALTLSYLAGHGTAAALWLASSIVAGLDLRLTLWAIAFVIDLATPALTVDHSVRTPPHPTHLPERFGLFTLILLGESVVAVMRGIESQETWSAPAALSAFLGMATLFLVWWGYFDVIRAAAEHPVRTRVDAARVQLWTYAHFPLYLAIVVIGVGVQRIVTSATRAQLPASDAAMWAIGVGLLTVSMTIIALTVSHSALRRALRSMAVRPAIPRGRLSVDATE
jgi:low temperature requirement protein LtrA